MALTQNWPLLLWRFSEIVNLALGVVMFNFYGRADQAAYLVAFAIYCELKASRGPGGA